MRIIISLLLSIAVLAPALAQTEVEGNVEGEWTVEDEPYIVVDDIIVQGEDRLEIEPGVSVLFEPGTQFRVFGELIAVGTEDDSIYFNCTEEDRWWRSLRFLSASDDCEISYCVFENSTSLGAWQQETSRGGALYIHRTNATVTHSRFSSNRSTGQGASIYANDCEPVISFCDFTENHAVLNGGALCLYEADAEVTHNLMSGNTTEWGPGGMIVWFSDPVIEHNLIINNRSHLRWGCAIYVADRSAPTIRFNLMADNNGGAIYCGPSIRNVVFENNTIVNNRGDTAILLYSNSHLLIRNCIMWDNGDEIWVSGGGGSEAVFSDIDDAENEVNNIGEGVIDEDPQFVDPDNGDYSLDPESPCIDTGDPDSPEDPDGSRIEMGCFSFAPPLVITAIPDQLDLGLIAIDAPSVVEFQVTYQTGLEDPPALELEVVVPEEFDWIAVEPEMFDIEAGDTVDVELTAVATEELGVDEAEAEFSIVAVDMEGVSETVVVTAFVVEGFGTLTGTVTDASNDEPIENATVSLEGLAYQFITDEAGRFGSESIPSWEYTASVEVEDFLPYESEPFTIEPDEEEILEIEMLFAACVVEPDSINVQAPPDSSAEFRLSIVNTGTGDLVYDISKRFPNLEEVELGSIAAQFDAAEQCEDNRLQGIEYVDGEFYVTGGNNGDGTGLVHIFNQNGEYQESFDQFRESSYGMRDLAWDGGILWGGDDETIYGFTLEGDLEESFVGPLPLHRAITWDDESGLLWVCDLTTQIFAIDFDGNVIERMDGLPEKRIFGLATYYEDPDDARIYAFCRSEGNQTIIMKLNPETEEWSRVVYLDVEDGLRAGGACIPEGWDPMLAVFAGVLLGAQDTPDEIGIFQLAARTDWVVFDLDHGTIPVESDVELIVSFNSDGYEIDVELEAEIVITHNGRGDEINIPVTLEVIDPNAVGGGRRSIPTGIHLEMPFPNPTNGQLTVGFSLDRSSPVSIQLLDLNGRSIAELVSGDFTAGRYDLNLNTFEYPSGLYLIRMKAGRQLYMRKITLIK